MSQQSRIRVTRGTMGLVALQFCTPVVLGILAAILGNHPGFLLILLGVVAIAIVAVDVSAISPEFRLSFWEIGIFVSSVAMGIVLFWAAFALFEIGFFTPFVLGLVDRGPEDVRALYIDHESTVTAQNDFGRTFGGYLAVAGLVSVPIGGVAGAVGCMSRWRPLP